MFTNRAALDAGGAAAAVTWDPANGLGTQITLSNGNLTATSSGTSSGSAQTTTTHGGTDKKCLEVHMTGAFLGTNSWIAGLIRTTASFPAGYVVGQNGTNWQSPFGTGLGVGTTATNAGDFEMVCIDFGAELIWNKSDSNANWNNNASANPATGVGGANIAVAFSGGAPFVFLVDLLDTSGQVATLNVTSATFHFSTDWISLSAAGYTGWN